MIDIFTREVTCISIEMYVRGHGGMPIRSAAQTLSDSYRLQAHHRHDMQMKKSCLMCVIMTLLDHMSRCKCHKNHRGQKYIVLYTSYSLLSYYEWHCFHIYSTFFDSRYLQSFRLSSAMYVRILPWRRIVNGRLIRYTVEVVRKYKTNVRLSRKEYIWLPISCRSKVRFHQHYLIMGRTKPRSTNGKIVRVSIE